ncbi:MAG: SPOR domain-containing protein [Desulfobacterales bacterium]|nr:SPOR domain-containing protein [Desulfobacterales bacterium]
MMKYTVYLFVGGWMFFLGIMVGRNSLPLEFDTRGFQERLARIAQGEPQVETPVSEKVSLDLSALNTQSQPLEKFPGKSNVQRTSDRSGDADTGPVKMIVKNPGLKAKGDLKKIRSQATSKPGKKKDAPPFKTALKKKKTKSSPPVAQGHYTIQVAAYNAAKDAAKEQARLKKKGFDSIQKSKKIKGVTWYRIRVGSWNSRAEAKQMLEKLRKAGIKKGLIIKKD